MKKKNHSTSPTYCYIGNFSMSVSKSKYLLHSEKKMHDKFLLTKGPLGTDHVCNLYPFLNNTNPKYKTKTKHLSAEMELATKSDLLCRGKQVKVRYIVFLKQQYLPI